MYLKIDKCADLAIYRQIYEQLKSLIQRGCIGENERLPAVRKLAADAGVTRGTVENAYGQLEAEGLIASKRGSGFYVLEQHSFIPTDNAELPKWQLELAGNLAKPSLQLQNADEFIDFGRGTSDTALFCLTDFRRSMQAVLTSKENDYLDYGDTRGYRRLRMETARILGSQGISIEPDNILITSGSQHALSLTARGLLQQRSVVIVENPTYSGALDIFKSIGAEIVPVAIDSEGMNIDRLEEALKKHSPRLIYTIPNFQNPTGVCLSAKRRRELCALAWKHNCAIFEDDYVGDLRYNGPAIPPLKSFDTGSCVLYAGTFSKMLVPGLRIGFIVAEGPILEHLTKSMKTHYLASSNLTQHALAEFMSVGRHQRHLGRSRRVYRRRRDFFLKCAQRHLCEEISISRPSGGLFCWAELHGNYTAADLLRKAQQNKVSFTDGSTLHTGPYRGEKTLRLNFSCMDGKMAEEGLKRLGRAMRSLRDRAQ